jgi:hypothetical protein
MSVSAKSGLIVAVGVFGFLSGAIGQYLYPGLSQPLTDIPFAIGGALLLLAWCRVDSDEMNIRRSAWLTSGVVLCAIIAIPYYPFRSRGAKRGILAFSLFVLGVIGYLALGILGQFTTHYLLQH